MFTGLTPHWPSSHPFQPCLSSALHRAWCPGTAESEGRTANSAWSSQEVFPEKVGFEGCVGVHKGADEEETPGRGNCFCWTLQAITATLRSLNFIPRAAGNGKFIIRAMTIIYIHQTLAKGLLCARSGGSSGNKMNSPWGYGAHVPLRETVRDSHK